MKTFLVVVCLFGLVGCGGSGSSNPINPPSPTAATNIVAGPWTGMATSSGTAGTSFVIANLTDQGAGSFFAASANAQVCAQFHPECLEDLPQESSGICCRYTIQGTVGAKGAVTITIAVLGADVNNTQHGTITVTGTLSSDGKSMKGTYSSTYTNGTAPDSGNFTASLSKPVTGNYSGSLTSGVNGLVFPVTASLTEASDGTITGSASVSNSSCLSTMTFAAPSSFAIGGGFHLWGTNATSGTSADVIPNGDGTFAVSYSIGATTCSDAGRGTVK